MWNFTTLMVTIVSLVTIAVGGFPYGAEDNAAHELHLEDQAAVAATQHDQTQPQDDSDLYMESQESQATSSEEPMEGGQTFYPSFSPFNHPPLGHSRPFLYQQEGAYSHRAAPYQQQVEYDSASRYGGYKADNYARGSESASLLGSGNFGVIRGGTFYHENEESNYEYDPYFRHNGHGRPGFGYGGNPKPRQQQQFENFRDFADINVPSNPAYSQYVIVYANKNITSDPLPNNKPKNIIEHLQMLDLETTTSTTEAAPTKKLSKYKQKLALAKKLEKKYYKSKNPKSTTTSATTIDQYEPLLALS